MICARRAALATMLVLYACSGALIAGPVAHFSRTGILFGGALVNTSSSVQPVFVTNTGDATLSIDAWSLTGAQASYFLVSGTCTPPVLVAPGDRCRIDAVYRPLGSPPPFGTGTATLTVQSNATPSRNDVDLSGDTDLPCGGCNAPFTPSPPWLEFDPQAVGTASAPGVLTLTSTSFNVFNIQTFRLIGGDAADFMLSSNCRAGGTFVRATPCAATVSFVPQASGPRSTELEISTSAPNGEWTNRYSITGTSAGTAIQPLTVVEYYNAVLDHYFVTWVAAEQANLDLGNTPTKWTRTGYAFRAYTVVHDGASPVCRYYLPPLYGDSHFFGRGAAECNATGAAHPAFVLEDPAFMYIFLPVAGVCPPGTAEVYRVFSNRADANHRYMTDRAVRDQMVARGWLAEGDGPNLVVMCWPQVP